MKYQEVSNSEIANDTNHLSTAREPSVSSLEPEARYGLHESQERIEKSHDRYADLYDFAPIGYVTLTETGLIEDINMAGAALLGHPRERLINMPFTSCMTSYYHRTFEDHLTCCRERGQAVTELQLRMRCGKIFDAQMLSATIPHGEREEYIYRTALIDISQRRQTEDALRKSELKFRSLYSSMLEGFAFFVVVYDAKGKAADYRILDINPAFEKITGINRERAMGSKGSELFGQEPPPYLEIFSDVAASGKPTVFEAPSFLGKATARISVFSPAKGSFATVFEDITKRKRTEEALRESEQRYRRLVEHAPDAIVVYSREKFAYANNAAYKLFGAHIHEQLIGQQVIDMVQPDCRGVFIELMRLAEEGIPSPLREIRLIRLDGSLIDVEVVGTPITYRGKPSMQAMLRDVTERRHAKEELQRANDELEKRVFERTEQLAKTIDALQKEIFSRRETEKALRSSEERYALAVQGANDGIWDCDLETGDLYLSPRWKGILGYAEDELENSPLSWKSHIHPDDYEQVMEQRRAYLAGEIPSYQIEHRLRHSDGSYRWILTRGACLRDAEGKAYRLAGSHTDVTESKLAKEKILRLNHLYSVLSETNKAIVRAADRTTLFNEVCRVAYEHGGFRLAWVGIVNSNTGLVDPVAAAGTGIESLSLTRVSVLDGPDGTGLIGLAVREGVCRFSNDILNDPCAIRWRQNAARYAFQSAAATVLRLNGQIIGVLSLFAEERDYFDQQLIDLLEEMAADISFALNRFDRDSRHREAEQALQAETARRLKAVEALREREQMLMQQSRLAAIGEMIGNIAHQWRQPLNTLGLYLQGLTVSWQIDGFDRQHSEEMIAKAMQVIFHMSQTIDDFRYFFKPDKEKIQFQARELVSKTVSLIEGSYKDRHIELEVVAQEDPSLVGYPNEYSQVLLNILSNARDALIERQIAEPRVAVRLFTDRGRSVVTITDNAGGIPDEILNKIFDPYFTTKDPDKGTGVGLFISKTIIEKNMAGRLTACNRCDGAEFRIEV